jgi:hypothetical protein
MALANYSDLQAAIANYLARPGDTLVATPAPDFVVLAESRIAYGGDAPFQSSALRIRAMEATAVLITGGVNDAGTGAGTANAQTASLAATPTLVPGFTVSFTAVASNTAATTFNLNGLGAITIKKGVPQADLAAGDIIAGRQLHALL